MLVGIMLKTDNKKQVKLVFSGRYVIPDQLAFESSVS